MSSDDFNLTIPQSGNEEDDMDIFRAEDGSSPILASSPVFARREQSQISKND